MVVMVLLAFSLALSKEQQMCWGGGGGRGGRLVVISSIPGLPSWKRRLWLDLKIKKTEQHKKHMSQAQCPEWGFIFPPERHSLSSQFEQEKKIHKKRKPWGPSVLEGNRMFS